MAAIHELADRCNQLEGEVFSLNNQVSGLKASLECACQELSRYQKLARAVGCMLGILDTLKADEYGNERFVRKLKGHFWSLQVDLIEAREGCSEEEALAIWAEGRREMETR